MLLDPLESYRLVSSSKFDDPILGPKSFFRFHSPSGSFAISDGGKPSLGLKGYGGPRSYDPANDYVVGEGDTRHGVMVEQFLRLLCEETPRQTADAVVLVGIPGRVYGYGYRRDSLLAGALAHVKKGFITDVLAENMKRHWLNRNIECMALQKQHWRIFRWYAPEATHMILMDFHPIETQRTALVLWVLDTKSSYAR